MYAYDECTPLCVRVRVRVFDDRLRSCEPCYASTCACVRSCTAVAERHGIMFIIRLPAPEIDADGPIAGFV